MLDHWRLSLRQCLLTLQGEVKLLTSPDSFRLRSFGHDCHHGPHGAGDGYAKGMPQYAGWVTGNYNLAELERFKSSLSAIF